MEPAIKVETKRVAALDTSIAETLERFQSELRQRDDLVSNRAEWIEREARQSAKYVPMPQGLIDQLKALWVLAAGSTDIFWLVVGTKVLIMLLESAGPLTKFFFTTPGIYGLYASMRVHDAIEVEAAWRRPSGHDDTGVLGGGAGDRASRGHTGRRSPFGEKLGAEKPQAAE